MTKLNPAGAFAFALATLCSATKGAADSGHARHQDGAVASPASEAIHAGFDILAAHVHRDGPTLVFHMSLDGTPAGAPEPVGSLAGAPVHAYVWPTTLDPSSVGFEDGTGLLALVATAHPDFDDTPLYDENADGDLGNDGGRWHSHWVVLTPNPACGAGALSVRDIAEGEEPALPATWPGLPLFIDSPGYSPRFDGSEIIIRTPAVATNGSTEIGYDGVTSALRVNADLHAPMLCVEDVFDVASGDLSLPGRIAAQK